MYEYFKYKNNYKLFSNIKSKMVLGSSNRKNRLFTIAIPTFKRPNFLENALRSALNQVDVNDYEIVIIDNDNSSSIIEEIVKKYSDERVYYFRNEENIGMFGNWNRCIEHAKGEYITILNDDDWLSENYLNRCIQYLKDDLDGLYFPSNRVDCRGEIDIIKKRYQTFKKMITAFSKTQKKLTLFDFFLGNKSAGTLGVVLKTEYLKKLGGYNPDYFPSSDYVLHSKYCHHYNVHFINEKLNYYRIAENESAKQETLKKWEYLDNDIRSYFISVIGRKKCFLNYLNKLIQENRVEGLVNTWNYCTGNNRQHNLSRKVLKKLNSLKDILNI